MKRVVTLLLSACLLILPMVGCSFFEIGEDPAESTAESAAVTTTEASNDGAESVVEDAFYIKGKKKTLLASALESAGVKMSEDKNSAKLIYVGDSESPLTASAKEKTQTRENNHNDYAILSSGDEIAIYGNSDHAIREAVAYFVSQYVQGGRIVVESELNVVAKPETVDVRIAGKSLKGLCVVAADSSYQRMAVSVAESLSVLTGYTVKESSTAGDYNLTLAADNASAKGEFSKEYTVSVASSNLTISAPTFASLAYGTQIFLKDLTNGVDFSEGINEKRNFEMKHADATNVELFKYCGTWQATDSENPTTMVSYWNAGYVEVDFTGNAITLEFSKESSFKVKMDDNPSYVSYTADGQITLFAEGDGEHTIRIYNNNRKNHLYFAGVSVADDVQLSRTADKKHYVQFVGDSISENGNSFTFRVGDVLGWDFSVSAVSGMALEDNYGFWRKNNGGKETNPENYTEGSMAKMIYESAGITSVGMETAFFKLGSPDNVMTGAERELYGSSYYTEALDNKYQSGNTPDIVFLFLGTNDELHRISEADRFTEAYVKFVQKILDTYGKDTEIVVLQAVSNGLSDSNADHNYYNCIRKAGQKLELLYPSNVTFIDRDVISTWNIEISDDKIHPTKNGYDTMTTEIAKLLESLF